MDTAPEPRPCHACGYNRRGLGFRRCPECGAWPARPNRPGPLIRSSITACALSATTLAAIGVATTWFHVNSDLPWQRRDSLPWVLAVVAAAAWLALRGFRRSIESWPAPARLALAAAAWSQPVLFPLLFVRV
jgi:hypothetical protein